MQVTVLQTSDQSDYLPIFNATSRTAREFCRRQALAYEGFVGVKRGLWSWHSTYNRIYMIKELLDGGYNGWLIYMDADAYIHNLDFPIAGYLATYQTLAGIFVRVSGLAPYWDVNAGVFLLNAGHPLTRKLVETWIAGHESVFARQEFLTDAWPDIDLRIDDQGLLNEMLIANPEWQFSLHYESQALINSMHASFLRHHMRAHTPDLAQRTTAIAGDVEDILSKAAAKDAVGSLPVPRISSVAHLRKLWPARKMRD
ncbi:hypothetical protein [Bradyrhizobium sp.]|uniref:hypothetical protein n=1 Tax=Bradyrhizobium sp. TaxID=376 RepID=UPI0039E7228C